MSIVKDSSVWESTDAFVAARKQDMSIRVGMVRDIRFDDKNKTIKYVVEVFDKNNQIPVLCTRLDHFGGVYNYEDRTHQTFVADNNISSGSKYATRAGDLAIVAFLNGDSREGVILGGIKHPGRPDRLTEEDGVAYKSEFNGIETSINSSGEYRVTFKGVPTNIDALDEPPDGDNVPEPEYDLEVGTSYMEMDATGSYTVSDNATENPQAVKIDKPNGTITVTSGLVVIKMTKEGQIIDVATKQLNITAEDSMSTTTTNWSTEASATAKIKSPKIAFGTDGVELLDEIVQLITNIGLLTPISPVGPCATMMASPQWAQVEKVKTDINRIKGSL